VKIRWIEDRERDFILTISLALTIYLFIAIQSNAYSPEVYPKDEAPVGTKYQDWIEKWWSWWIKTNTVGLDPNGCIINKSGPMVMLMETTRSGNQVCEISSNQSIMVPLWTGFCSTDVPEQANYTTEQLLKCAREQVNLGAVTSLVSVDDNPIAKLDEISSMRAGSLDYRINSMENVTEGYSTGFNVTYPEDSYWPDLTPGKWFHAGAHGWFVFLKPLSVGDHKLSYNVGVTGTGPNDSSAEITYTLKVK
jgi:hypothetical protein